MNNFDIIVIGGGVNSLVASILLGKSGKDVILFESRNVLGGLASTEEFNTNYKCNKIYDYLPWANQNIINTLNLNNYGLKTFEPDPMRIALDKKGNHICFYKSPDNTASSIAQHSREDAEKWPYFSDHIKILTEFLKPIYTNIPPNIPKIDLLSSLNYTKILKPLIKYGTRGAVNTLKTVPMMMPEFLDEWFESKLLRGSLSSTAV